MSFLWSWTSVATHVWLFVNAASKLTLTKGGGRGIHVLVPLYLISGFPGLQMSFCRLRCAPCLGSVKVLCTICLFLCIQITSQHVVAYIDKFLTSPNGTLMELFGLNTIRIHSSIDDRLSSSILKGRGDDHKFRVTRHFKNRCSMDSWAALHICSLGLLLKISGLASLLLWEPTLRL